MRLRLIIFMLLVLVLLVFSDGPLNPPKRNVCCVDQDGYCHDIGVDRYDSRECGERTKWQLTEPNKLCNTVPRCQRGCCYINGKLVQMPKNYYECESLSTQTGDVSDFTWEQCAHPNPYIDPV